MFILTGIFLPIGKPLVTLNRAPALIGDFHDGVISLQLPESFTSNRSYANYGSRNSKFR